MPDENTQVVEPTTDAAQPTTEDSAAEPGTSPEGDAPAPETVNGLSPDLAARIDLINAQSGIAEDLDEPEVEEPAPAPAKRAATSATATEAAGTPVIDEAALAKQFEAEIGPGSAPIAKLISGTINSLAARVQELQDQLEAVGGLPDELKKVSEKIAPLAERVDKWAQREQAQINREIHGFFDKQTEFADKYGKGDPKSHSPLNQRYRSAISARASLLLKGAAAIGDPLTLQEALEAAHATHFKGQVTKAGATAAVRASVQKQARGLSVDPGRGTGSRSTQPETEEQEHARQLAGVHKVLAQAGKGRR